MSGDAPINISSPLAYGKRHVARVLNDRTDLQNV
jgi:hypothetical protein